MNVSNRLFVGLAAALAVVVLGGLHPAAAEEEDVAIASDDGAISVRYDAADGSFSASRGGKPFIKRATFGDFLPAGQTKVRRVQLEDAIGRGRAIGVTHPSGRVAIVAVYDGLPMVCIKTSIHNPTDGPLTLGTIAPLAAELEFDVPANDLATLGYDGLAGADQAKTTYLCLSVADPRTRAGTVCGWLTHDRASGIVAATPEGDSVTIKGRSDYGHLLVPPGETVEGETLAIGYFDDALDGLELYADTIAKVYHIRVKKVPSGYMTWYHARALDEKRMPVLAAWCAEHLKPFGFDFLQIDDGWQVSRRDFTGHDPKGPYPSGMKPTAKAVNDAGFMAGIWVTPFGWDHKRPVFADHQDWFVRREDGSVYAVKWGGDCLDVTHPEARQFLHGVMDRISNDWGYKFYKLDALWAGVAVKLLYPDPTCRPDSFGDARFHDPGKSNIEAFREGLRTVRDAVGPDAYLLGCTVSQNMRTMGGSIGLVDGIRIGRDSGRKWQGIVDNVKVSTATYYLHGRVWHNDPDVLYLDKSFTLEQVRAWASWLAVTGQMYMTSDWLPDVPPERLDVVRRTIPNHNLTARPVDLYRACPARVWHLRSGEGASRRDVVALFNWGDAEEPVSVGLDTLGLPEGDYARYEFWTDDVYPRHPGPIEVTLPPKSCRVFSLRRCEHPVLISTSRHVTQGIVDLVELTEDFDKAVSDVLGRITGVSRVVGGDPYELRIAAPNVVGPWTVDAVKLSEADRQAGVTIKLTTGKENTLARIVITSPVSRNVRWQVEYIRGKSIYRE